MFLTILLTTDNRGGDREAPVVEVGPAAKPSVRTATAECPTVDRTSFILASTKWRRRRTRRRVRSFCREMLRRFRGVPDMPSRSWLFVQPAFLSISCASKIKELHASRSLLWWGLTVICRSWSLTYQLSCSLFLAIKWELCKTSSNLNGYYYVALCHQFW